MIGRATVLELRASSDEFVCAGAGHEFSLRGPTLEALVSTGHGPFYTLKLSPRYVREGVLEPGRLRPDVSSYCISVCTIWMFHVSLKQYKIISRDCSCALICYPPCRADGQSKPMTQIPFHVRLNRSTCFISAVPNRCRQSRMKPPHTSGNHTVLLQARGCCSSFSPADFTCPSLPATRPLSSSPPSSP